MPILSISTEKIEELERAEEQLTSTIRYYRDTTPEDLWLQDLTEFEEAWYSPLPPPPAKKECKVRKYEAQSMKVLSSGSQSQQKNSAMKENMEEEPPHKSEKQESSFGINHILGKYLSGSG